MDWSKELKRADKHEKEFRTRAQKCIDVYRDDKTRARDADPKMNLLWSNTETLRPALYSQPPQPVVNRRFAQQDPIARMAAEVLERTIAFSIDSGLGDFDLFANQIINDYLLTGRSVDRVCYRPLGDEEGLVFEEVYYKHVPWDQFRYDPVDRWCDVKWIAYGDHFYSWDELKDEFDLDESKKDSFLPATRKATTDDGEAEYQVWEIWDKSGEEVIWIIEGASEPLKREPPPVKLRGFFDCPEPLYSFRTNDSLIPIPEYTLYQYQAEEVNTLTRRISRIANMIRANYAYAGDEKNLLKDLLTADDGDGIPVANWTTVLEKGGIEGMIAYTPIEQYAKVLQILSAQRSNLIQQIFEITGISDILRGATDARETARAQALKANFGNRRLLPRQRDVQRYLRDLFRLAGEIIVENFERATLQDIVGKEIPDPVLSMLRSDADRAFKVDIETDSTIAPDEMQQKQDLAEFMGALANFMPAMQQAASLGGPQAGAAILLWAIRRFRAGREVEEILENAIQNPPPPQPDPNMVKAQMDMQAKQADLQLKTQEMQAELQMKQREHELKLQAMQKEYELKFAALSQEIVLDRQRAAEKMQQQQIEGQIKSANLMAQGAARTQAIRNGGRAA